MPTATSAAIEIHGLTKHYGEFEAVRGIDLRVERGEVVALLGPNGAGKTTTVEILEGYRRATSGEVRILGIDPGGGDASLRSRVGIVHQETKLPDDLTPMELLTFQATLFPRPLDAAEALHLVGLDDKARSRCSTLSGGQQRRLDVALGIIGDPEVVFLDEPTTGLDPEARRQAWQLVEQLAASGKTILLTTHYLDEAERLADRLAVIVAGRIVARGTPEDLGGRGQAAAVVSFRRHPGLPPLPTLPGRLLDAGESDGGSAPDAGALVRLRTDQPTAAVAALAAWSAGAGVPELSELAVTRRSLEDTYLALVAEHGPASGPTPPDPPDATTDRTDPTAAEVSR